MDKNLVKVKIIEELENQLKILVTSAHEAEQESQQIGIAPSQHDHRSLEASMLADAQSGRVLEAQEVVKIFKNLPLRDFSDHDEILPSALIEVEHNGESHFYFIGPRGAGTVVNCEGRSVEVITPFSPLGQELLEKHVDDLVVIESPKGIQEYLIKSVS